MIKMLGVNYKCQTFEELSVFELYSILQVRELVFTLEQEVFYKDLDDVDQVSLHLTGYKNSELVSYCRIIPPKAVQKIYGDDGFIKLGRLLTPPSKRKQGFGIQLLNQAIFVCKSITDLPIEIIAQAYLLKFYQGVGFVPIGEKFMYEGIEHITMRLNTGDVNIVNQNQVKFYPDLV